MVALITPFTKENTIDFEALGKIIDDVIEQGVDGLVMLGTTAESATLNNDERWMLYHFIMRYVEGKVPVYAGIGTNDTMQSLVYLKMAQEAKVDGVMIVTPYYNRPQQEGLYQHFKFLADHTVLPVMLYSVPKRCGVDLDAETVIRLAKDCENIVALKYAAADLSVVESVRAEVRRPFAIYSGEDGMLLEGLRKGMDGIVSVIGHIYGSEMKQVVDAYKQGIDHIEMDFFLKQRARDLFCESSPVPLKYAMHVLGKCEPYVRLPLVELRDEHKKQVQETINYQFRT